MAIEFSSWGKTPRLFRDIIITEKIDGSNCAVIIEESYGHDEAAIAQVVVDGVPYDIGAQSRKRLITPGKTTDNYDFAQWVEENADLLVRKLGVGHHFGEWWGKGIQKRYDVEYRAFSLFNTERYKDLFFRTATLNGADVMVDTVPVVYEGPFSERAIQVAAKEMLEFGSVAAAFTPNPEGLCIYHTQSGQVYKFTFDNNDKGKWETLA